MTSHLLGYNGRGDNLFTTLGIACVCFLIQVFNLPRMLKQMCMLFDVVMYGDANGTSRFLYCQCTSLSLHILANYTDI